MALADMVVFNKFMYAAATETIAQQIQLFNEATRGALTLRSASSPNVGDFAHEVTYGAIANLMRRRNAYGSGSVGATKLSQLDHVAVKIAGGTSPVEFEPQQFAWIQRSPEEAGVVIGEQVARGIMADEVNTAILALMTAMAANAGVAHDATAGTLSLSALNKGAAKFGDRAMDLSVWIAHSKAMHDLYDGAIANANSLFEFGTVRVVQDGFGRRLIMTDSPALFADDAGGVGVDHYHTLGLVPGAAVVEDNGDYYATMEEKTGGENIQRIFQAEYTYNLGLKGYAWNTAVKSPTDAAIGTGGNWTKLATSNKDTAGVIITSL